MPPKRKTGDVTVALTGIAIKAETGRLAANTRVRNGRRRGKPVREEWKGQEYSSSGVLVNKERIIDRDANNYKEVVVVADTGEVLRDIDEPLSKHQGRGMAKPGRRHDR